MRKRMVGYFRYIFKKISECLKEFVNKTVDVVSTVWQFYFAKNDTQNVVDCKTNDGDLKLEFPEYKEIFGTEFQYEPDCDLSIIVPVYNVSAYIEECVESVRSQKTDYSYEIILVDDGSTDDTWQKIQKYADQRNVYLYQQANAGQSAARNRAMRNSHGRYLMFLDGDDILLPDAIEKLMKSAQHYDADIAEGAYVWFYQEITDEMLRESEQRFHIESNQKNRKFVLNCVGYSYAKVYRRELWKDLCFPEGFIFEDIITKFILRRIANRVVFIKDAVYGYRHRNNSSTHKNDTKKKLDSLYVFPVVVELTKKSNAPMDDVFYYLSLTHIGLLNRIITRSLSKEVQISCLAEMKKQLVEIKPYRPKRMPFFMKLLEESILNEDYANWVRVSETILKHDLLKKYREFD